MKLNGNRRLLDLQMHIRAFTTFLAYHENKKVEPVEAVQKIIYESNTYKKRLKLATFRR